MSSSLEISTADESFPKVVLHERNKPEMGTNYIGAKTRITVKRNIVLGAKSKESETNALDKKIRKYDRAPVRSKKQHISSENSDRKKNLPERKIITKSTKSEKGCVNKSDLSKISDVNDRNVKKLIHTNESVSDKKSNTGDIKKLETMSNNCSSGSTNTSQEVNKISQMIASNCQNSVFSTQKMMLSKDSDIDNSLPEHDLEISQTPELSILKNVSTKLQHISSCAPLAKSRSIHMDNSTVTTTCSDTRKQTSPKKSIPKPQSVILNSCDSQQKNFQLSDVNKDTFCISNTSDLMRQDCNKDSDLDQIGGVLAASCKEAENFISHSKECMEQTVKLTQNTKLSAQNTKPDKKSSLQGSIPSYLRLTSSVANKEIKKKFDNTKRSVSQENSAKSASKQSFKVLKKNELKCSSTKKDPQSGLRTEVKSNVKRNKAYDISFVEDRKSSASTPEDYISDVNSSSTSSETETTTNCLNKNLEIQKPKCVSSQPQQVHTTQKVALKDKKSCVPQNLKLPVKSKTNIQKVSKECVAKKQITTPMALNIRTRSLTSTDSKHVLFTSKRHNSQDTSMSSKSRSTTPGASSISSDNSCSNNGKLSSKPLKNEDTLTNDQKVNKFCMEREKMQKQKSAVRGLNIRPRSLTPTDSKSLSLTIKRQNSQDTSQRSRSTTPDAPSILPDDISSYNTKLSSKTLDLHPQNILKGKNDKQLKVLKSKQDSKMIKVSKTGLQTLRYVKSNRDSSSRQRSDTPLATAALAKTSDMKKYNKTRSDDQMISNMNKTKQSPKRDIMSRSRSNTPDVSSARSGNSTVSYSSNVPHSSKASSSIEGQAETIKSNKQSKSVNLSSPSESKSSSVDTLPSDKAKAVKTFKENDLEARSRTNASDAPSSLPGNISHSNQMKAHRSNTKTGRTIKISLDSRVKSNKTETANISQGLKETKQGTNLKGLSSKVKQRSKTPCNLNIQFATSKISPNSSPTTAVLRNQGSKNSSKNDRKSRSRSSTQCASSLPQCSNTSKGSYPDHKLDQEEKPTFDQLNRKIKVEPTSKIPREISSKSRKCNDIVSQNFVAQKQEEITPVLDFSKQYNEHCKDSTKTEKIEQSELDVIKTVQVSQVSPTFDIEINQANNTKIDISICTSTKCLESGKESAVNNQSKNNLTTFGSNNIQESRTITVLDSKQPMNASCNSFSTISGNLDSKSKAVLGILGSKCNSSNKIKMLSTQEGDKPILELTELSVKPDSRTKSGKIQNSVKYKNSQLQASLDNRSRQECGRKNTRKSAIKTQASDNKLRQAQRMSAIKIDDISTRPSSKSNDRETRKQNSQLRGKLTLSNVNSKSEAQCVYVTDELIGKEPCKTLEVKDVSSLILSDNQNSVIKEITKLDLIDNIQNESVCKENDNLKDLDLNINDNHENSTLLLEQSTILCEKNHCNFSSVKKDSENLENINCTDLNSRKYQFATCTQCREIYSSDRKANANDPESKVINNCLSDVRENEIKRVNCETHTGISTGLNEIENSECEVILFKEINHLMTCKNETDLETVHTINKMESINFKPCSNCKLQKNCSLTLMLEVEDDFLCDSCKEATENDSKMKCEKDELNIVTSCMTFDEKDTTVEYSTGKCDGNYTKLNCFNPTQFEQQRFTESVCQSDKKSENSTFKIDIYEDIYDVNSSNEMPITEGCAFKHTDNSDLQEDKANCTHAMPVTGAVSFQSTYKRQDKKIASLSNCGKRNPALCSNKNCLLRNSDKFIVPHFDSSCECARMEKGITSNQKENDDNRVMMSPTKKYFTSNITEMNDASSSPICVDSFKAEQSVSDWHTAEILDIKHQENESKLQVINKCEINKENSKPKNIGGKVESRDILSCEYITEVQEFGNGTSYTDGVNIIAPKCGKMKDLNLQNMERTVGNDVSNFQCDNMKNSSPNTSFHDVYENVVPEKYKNVNENDKENPCLPFKNKHESEVSLLEGPRQEKTLTCGSESVDGMNFPDEENNLPEQNSRAMDVKLINTDHDVSLDTYCINENASKISHDLCHTGLLLDNNDAVCDCESDKNTGNRSNDADNSINGILPITDFLQNQLQRLKPGGYLSDAELKKDMTCKPYVLEAQEKQTNCFYYGNDAQCLFLQESSIEDGLIMFHCENEDSFQQKDTPVVRQKAYFQDKGYFKTDKDKHEKNKSSMDESSKKQFKCVPNLNNSSFCNIPKLSEIICEIYPNLKEKTKFCNESSNKEEIKQEDKRCSNMTQNANMNTCFSNMKLNDSACLFQSYTQLDRDDIKVHSECLHCADLSQTSANISNCYSKKLHSQDDLTEANSAEHGSLKITGYKLCTETKPCDGSKGKISTHISLSKSTENSDLKDLSLPFDVCEDICSGWTMSRDSMRVAAIGTELCSELSANLTDSETLKTHNPGSNQDCYEDKDSGELSVVKITTQKSSCNLKFSEKSNEPKDLLLRYKHHKNSAGHKKIYSCKDELDIGIACTQEEYNFRNLAAIRDEDINCEIKLNNINLETPKHCVTSSLESARSNRKVILTGIQGQCSELELNQCTVDNDKYFETPNKLLIGHLDSNEGNSSSKGDVLSKEILLSCGNEDIRLSSGNPEHRSDKCDLQIHRVENGLLLENSIKTDICQTEGDVNALLTLNKDESIQKLNLPEKNIFSVSGVEYAENKCKNQTNEFRHREINLLKTSDSDCTLDVQKGLESEYVINTDITSQKKNINSSTEIQDLSIANENYINEGKQCPLQENIQQLDIHDCAQSANNGNENASNIRENLSLSEETLSDASEAFTDAEDRLSSPNTENISTLDCKHCLTGSKELNISCGASTSTESFVDAVESLDDDYLTRTSFRNSREFQNEETVSQNSSSTNDSSTGIAGSMDDLSGWEEFSENIEDINDYNGDMEARNCAVTNIEGNNSHFCLTDDQTHAPVCITKHVFHDKNYQSPSPPSEPAELYLSKIKTSTLRYKDMRNDAEQKVIGSSIFETGNGGTIKDIDITGVRTKANNVRNVAHKGLYHIGDREDSTPILSNENEIQSNITNLSKISSKLDKAGYVVNTQENTVSQIESAVGSKIETAVIKRTERRRRRQIEQLKCLACDSQSKEKRETNARNIRRGEQARDNEFIEKISCSHSEHSKFSCTVSDNTTFNDEPASGTEELSHQVNTTLYLNELNIDHSLNSGTPLNYDCGDCVTNEVSIGMDKRDKMDKIDTTDTTDHTLADKKNEINSQLVETFICETQCERKLDVNSTVTENGISHNVIPKNEKVNINNKAQLTIEFREQHIERNAVDLDDIEFIDADESNQEDQISPNISFTFSFNENSNDIGNDKYDETNNAVATIYSEEEPMSCGNTVNSKESKPNTCILDIRDDKEIHLEVNVKEESTILEELEVIYEKNTFQTRENTGECQVDMKGVNTGEIADSEKVKESTATEIISKPQQNNSIIDIEADVCEESNISVRLALELEKQKLADDDETRSRKGLFMSKHAGRRATIETCSFENTEDAEKIRELSNDKDAKGKPEIKKSKSFRVDRKQISPMASFMNPPESSDSSDNKDSNENVDPVSKKVSDICKSFMTKTRSSAQKTRSKTLSKSPAPQRKLMKWVNNNGKWMRMPVDDTSDDRDETSANTSPSDISATSDSNEICSPMTPEITINGDTSKSVANNDITNEEKTDQCSHSNDSFYSSGTTQDDIDLSNIQSNEHNLIGDHMENAYKTKNENMSIEKEKHEDVQVANYLENTNLRAASGSFENISVKTPTDNDQDIKSNNETDLTQSDVLCNIEYKHSSQNENIQHISNTAKISKVAEHLDSSGTILHTETCMPEPDDEADIKVIGTTFDDAHCDQEKHRQRQELLFGLLDSFNRRKPRRLTPHEPNRNVQNSKKSNLVNSVENNIEKHCSDVSHIQKQETISDSNLKSIPKIKAVKIQEEVFECKTEYLKDTNIFQSPECGIFFSKKKLKESVTSNEESSKKNVDLKTMKLPIRKSQTFAGLGDIERQRHISRRLIGKEKFQTDTKQSRIICEKTENSSVNNENNEKELYVTKCANSMTDKRAKAGLKLNLEKTKARIKNEFEDDRSPIKLGPEQARGRTSGDRSPNRLCVDQPKVRLRSPEKGPRQHQRYKLLSEIVEVEENKDDVSVTCERQQQQQYYSDRQRPEGPKPVRRSNKRRSLSLPTGTLAFGDARIVYKNGHFTIETMDNSEYSCNESSDYHSSSQQLDGNVDDMWEMPDTGGDYSRVKSDSREATDKPHMRRQNAKTVLQSSDSTEDVFYSENEFVENVSPFRMNINGDTKVLNMGRTSEEVFNESCSSRTSDMSVESYYSEGMDFSTDESVTDPQKLSSSSLPDTKDVEVKRVMQRAKRTSSFRAAQEGGALRLSGIDEDKVHNSSRARSVSLDESQKSDLNKSPKIQSVQNQNPTFLKKVMSKRKTLNENLNISGFSKQSESAKEFFTKKMTLKGLFRKNKSDSSVNSPIKTEHPVSPPIATFQDDDIGSVDTPPGSPYRKRNLRRRHTSADILKTYPDSSETDSNCPTPTQERSNRSRQSISSPSTPSHEANSFLNLSSHSSAPQFRDYDEMSITSASSIASSIHSPPLEQPHKPKTPKPVGASPRRNQSFSSHLSRSSSQSSQRNVMNSVTSLESDQYEPIQDDVLRDPRCECVYRSEERKRRMSNRNVRGSTDSITMCQFCKQMEFYKSDIVFYKQQLTGKEKQSDDGARIRKDSSGRNNYDRLGIISQADVASSNSNDSGIQRDASVHSSNESIKGTVDTRLRLRRNKSLSPHPDRPKSEISVRWADGDSGDYDVTETTVKLRNKSARDRPRPKSDLDGSSFLSDRMKAFGSEINLQPYCSLRSLYEMKRNDLDRQKNRRMSTPHPIKSRLQRAPQKLHKQPPLVRSSSMPESLEKIHKRRKMHHLLDFHLDSLSRHMDIDTLSDESDLSFDQASLQERSVSVQSSSSQLTAMDEDEDNLTYAEALWDHITMDPEELGFRAQDVIEVLDLADKDWWFGVIDDREGWFPATFVRIRVNQDQLDDDLDLDTTIQDNLTTSPKLRRISMFNKNQARSNVVNEIINAEREYVKHLKDVVEGYIQHARKRTEMFPEERIALIFGNLEKIYSFAQKFVSQLEMCIDVCPHLSEIGKCFLDNERGFEIYSDYCNNHPSACEELDELCKDSKYKHFFEACRLLQELVEIPLEGFLLTPVQKICKYPLQLAELLKYTPPDHNDYMMVKDALAAMRKIATLINERKRKMESIEKIAVWQHSVVDWEGPDLLEGSSELIFSGELNKINTAGWSQERFFFLFDHQVVYCKKELLKRHVFSYKGRIDLDHCEIIDVPDGKDSQYNVTVKHGWKFHETLKDKWYLIYAKSEAVKQSWLKAIRDERQRVLEDQENDFCVPDHWKQTVLNKVRSQSHLKDKQSGGRMSHGQLLMQKDLKDFTYSTLPRHRISQKHAKKKGWFNFGGGKKSKR